MKKTVKIISWIAFFILLVIIHYSMLQTETMQSKNGIGRQFSGLLASIIVAGVLARFIIFNYLKRALYPKSELSNIECIWCGKDMDKRFGKYCSKKCEQEHEKSGTKKQPIYKDLFKD